MTEEIVGFLAQLRAQSSQPELIDRLEKLFCEVELMATTEQPMEDFLQALSAIVGRSDRTVKEKIATVHRLCATPDGFGHA
jgi:hypothetical protein